MPWDLFPPIVWTILIEVLIGFGLFGLWKWRMAILRGFRSFARSFARRLKSALWRKAVLIPTFCLGSLVVWRAWPLALIFTGLNMRSSHDFGKLAEYLPPESPATEIYGGLSHPHFEDEQLRQEILFGPRKIIRGHAFDPQKIAPDVVTMAIQKDLWSGRALRPWAGEKMCGGFHADYCLCWDGGDSRYEVMICLGCAEALLIRDGNALRCDLQNDFWHSLQDLADLR